MVRSLTKKIIIILKTNKRDRGVPIMFFFFSKKKIKKKLRVCVYTKKKNWKQSHLWFHRLFYGIIHHSRLRLSQRYYRYQYSSQLLFILMKKRRRRRRKNGARYIWFLWSTVRIILIPNGTECKDDVVGRYVRLKLLDAFEWNIKGFIL